MFGAPCSPCCSGCSAEALRAVYDRIRAASCSVSLTGTMPTQDAAVRFEPAIGGYYSLQQSQASGVLGSWYRWDQFECPSQLSLALASSSFSEQLEGDAPLTAQIVFSGNSDPSPQMYRSRLQVLLTILMRSGEAGSESAPMEGQRRYSLIPGTRSCYMLASANIQVRASGLTAGFGRLSASSVFVGNVFSMGPQNIRYAYAYSIDAPYYHFASAGQPQQELALEGPMSTVSDAGYPGGTVGTIEFGNHNAMWNYLRSLEFEPGATPPAANNQITGGAFMDILSDDAAVSDAENSMTMSLQSVSTSTFLSYGFKKWQPNAEQSATWGSSLSQPVLVDPNDIQPPYIVRFSYEVADKKFVDSAPTSPFVTALDVTLS